MYRSAQATGPIRGVEGGPYTGAAHWIHFDRLPPACRERLVASLRGVGTAHAIFAPDDIELRTTVRIGRRAAEGILEAATEDEVELILFGWGGPPTTPGKRAAAATGTVFSPTIDEVVREAPCDIAVVKQRGVSNVRRILVPVRGGPHAELALRFADALGRGLGAEVDAVHIVPPNIEPVVLAQTERALARIDDGTYGVCESCGNPIGKMRLMAFSRATLCMSCKQREERR